MKQTQFCSFFLDGLLFGVQVTNVQEVIRYQEMTRVPMAPTEIAGLINLRGQIVTAIDVRQRLERPKRAEGKQPMNVVIRSHEGAVSLLVDEIGGVVEVDQQRFELPPDTLEGAARELIQGAFKLDDCLLLILDIDKVMDVSQVESQQVI